MELTDGGPCAVGAQGAFHGAEVPFVFDVGGFLRTPAERQLAQAMWRLWVNFASSGDPNVPPTFEPSLVERAHPVNRTGTEAGGLKQVGRDDATLERTRSRRGSPSPSPSP